MSSWKKSILSVLLVILVLPLLFCNVDASKASKAKKAKKAYKKYVSAHTLSDPYMYGMKNPDYKIVDVNGDKITELLFINRPLLIRPDDRNIRRIPDLYLSVPVLAGQVCDLRRCGAHHPGKIKRAQNSRLDKPRDRQRKRRLQPDDTECRRQH